MICFLCTLESKSSAFAVIHFSDLYRYKIRKEFFVAAEEFFVATDKFVYCGKVSQLQIRNKISIGLMSNLDHL